MSGLPEPSSWNSLEVAKLIVSVLVPLAILGLGIWFDRRLKGIELDRQTEVEQRRIQSDERRREIERIYAPHIEFTVDCRCLGTRQDKCMLNIILVANNRGHVRHQFPRIQLRVRGIKQDEPLRFWAGQEPRAEFPHKLVDAEVVPPGYSYIFVEPGVAQSINYVTLIPTGYSLLLIKAEFWYDTNTSHSAESVFALPD